MNIWISIYFILLLSALLLGAHRWKEMAPADRLLIVLLVATTLHEVSSLFIILSGRGNLPSFHFYSPLELLITCWYFRQSSRQPWMRKAAGLAGLAGLAAGAINTICLQPLSAMNSNFLLYEATTIIVLCLLNCYVAALREEVSPFATVHFWVTLCLLMYWSFSFASYGMRGVPQFSGTILSNAIQAVLVAANLLFYTGLAIVFACYKHLRPSGE